MSHFHENSDHPFQLTFVLHIQTLLNRSTSQSFPAKSHLVFFFKFGFGFLATSSSEMPSVENRRGGGRRAAGRGAH